MVLPCTIELKANAAIVHAAVNAGKVLVGCIKYSLRKNPPLYYPSLTQAWIAATKCGDVLSDVSMIALIDPAGNFDRRRTAPRIEANANKCIILVLMQENPDVSIDRRLHSLQILLQEITRAGNCDCLTNPQIVLRENKVTAAHRWISTVVAVNHQDHTARYRHINVRMVRAKYRMNRKRPPVFRPMAFEARRRG
ncbi:hypothetical protein OKW34_002696 [Paraburkholderia youngii]